MEQEQAKFTGWAIVEMMGHQREAGYVTTESYGQAVLFRVDVPEFPERDYVLERPVWAGNGDHFSAGSKVRREAIAARSRLISPAAVYAINPCTEAAARKAIEAGMARPLILLEAPKDRTLSAGETEEEQPLDCEDCNETEGQWPRLKK